MGEIALDGSGKVTCQGQGEIRIKSKSGREEHTERDEIRTKGIELRALNSKPSDSGGGAWQASIGGLSNNRYEGEKPGRVDHSVTFHMEGEY